jgi:hypothetical protein
MIAPQILSAIATLLAVIVALFGDRLRYLFDPHKLRITLGNVEGSTAAIYVLDHVTNTATLQTPGIWYHIRVETRARWRPVTEVYIFLLSIEVPDAAGVFQRVEHEASALGWRNDPSTPPKKVGYPAECDLCHVLKEPREMRIGPAINKGPILIRGSAKMRLTLKARGLEADSNTLRVEVSWDGQWSDDRAEMRRHLVVKEA